MSEQLSSHEIKSTGQLSAQPLDTQARSSSASVSSRPVTGTADNKAPVRVKLKTKDDNDCAFHAVLGVWDDKEQQVICAEAKQRRAEVKSAIAESKLGSRVRELAVAGIRELIMAGRTIGEESRKLLNAHQRFLADQNTLSPQLWQAFEAALRKSSDAMQYIAGHHQHPRGALASLRDQFYDALNRNEGDLYAIVRSLTDLDSAFKHYNELDQTRYDWEGAVSSEAIAEYAQFVGKPGQWLLQSEVAILAEVFRVTVEYYSAPGAKVEIFNPGQQNKVVVQFNGTNHFEQMYLAPQQPGKKEEKKPEPLPIAAPKFKFAVSFSELEKVVERLADKAVIKPILTRIQKEMQEIESFFPFQDRSLYYPQIREGLEAIGRLLGQIPTQSGFYHSIRDSIKNAVTPLQKEVNAFFLQEDDISDTQLLVKTQALYAQQALIMRDDTIRKALSDTLDTIKQELPDARQGLRCFISYAWPTIERQQEEYWLQSFLRVLHSHLRQAGIQPLLDIIDNRPGANIVTFTNQIKECEFAILICTDSLADKHNDPRFKTIQTELSLLRQKYDLDIVTGQVRVFPFLVSGNRTRALLPEHTLYRTVWDWRSQSYLKNLEQLTALMCYPQGVSEVYQKIWQDFYAKYPVLTSLMPERSVEQELASQWHQREMEKLAHNAFYQGVLDQQSQLSLITSSKVDEGKESKGKISDLGKAIRERILKAGAQNMLASSAKQHLELYIKPDASKENSPKETSRFPLINRIKEFLVDPLAKSCAILGDSGSGKSLLTFWLEQDCRTNADKDLRGILPIYVALKRFTVEDAKHCVVKTLQESYDLNTEEIDQLRKGLDCQQRVLFIFDGFDEIRGQHTDKLRNIFREQFRRWPYAKSLVTCRTQYLPDQSNHINLFSIEPALSPHIVAANFHCYYLASFSSEQITRYLNRMLAPLLVSIVENPMSSSASGASKEENKSSLFDIENRVRGDNMPSQSFTVKEYENYFTTLPGLKEIVGNPYILRILTQALPQLLKNRQKQGSETRRVTRFAIYSAFMDDWFEWAFGRLVDEEINADKSDIKKGFRHFACRLAWQMFIQKKTDELYYRPASKKGGWANKEEEEKPSTKENKAARWEEFFTNNDPDTIRARQACPLHLVTDYTYSFIHKSFWEYFVARHLQAVLEKGSIQLLIENFNCRALQEEPAVLLFLVESLQALPTLTYNTLLQKLEDIVLRSARQKDISQASSNAATLLNWCGSNLMGKKWQGVQLPGADLRYSVLAHTEFTEANLTGARLAHAVLHGARFEKVDFRAIQWGEQLSVSCAAPITTMAHHPRHPWVAIAQGNRIEIRHRDTGAQVRQSLIGHTADITCLAFNSDGSVLVSASGDKTIRGWRVALYNPLLAITDEAIGGINSIDVNPIDQLMRVVGNKMTLQLPLSTVNQGKEASLISSGASIMPTPQGKQQTLDKDFNIRLGSISSMMSHAALGQPLLRSHQSKVHCAAFSPNGQLLASGDEEGNICLWDNVTGTLKASLWVGHTGAVTTLAFSPDGRQLASGSRDTTIQLWHVSNGQPAGRPLHGHTGGVSHVVFSPSGELLASGAEDATVRLWDVTNQQQHGEPLRGHTRAVNCVAFKPDGKQLVSASEDNTVQLWDVASQKPLGLPLQGHSEGVTHAAFSADGQLLVSASRDKSYRAWDMTGPSLVSKPLSGHRGVINDIAFSPNGQLLASVGEDGTVQVWDTASQQQLGKLSGHTSQVTCLAFSPHGKWLATGSQDETVRLWDIATQSSYGQPLSGHRWGVARLAFMTDDQLMVVSENCTMQCWDARHQRLVGEPLEVSKESVCSMALSFDRTVLATGQANTIQLWDFPSRQRSQSLNGHTSELTSLVFNPIRLLLASADEDAVIRLWALDEPHAPSRVLQGHQQGISQLAFSPDGWLLASSSYDKTVRLWDVARECCVQVISWPHPVRSVAFSPITLRNLSSKPRAEEYALVLADSVGTLSFWAISKHDFTLRFIGMPAHEAMPLLTSEIYFKDCETDERTRRLLNPSQTTIVIANTPETKETKSPPQPKSIPKSSFVSAAPLSRPVASDRKQDASSVNVVPSAVVVSSTVWEDKPSSTTTPEAAFQQGERCFLLCQDRAALPYLLQAAESSHVPACLRLGQIYHNGGHGVAKNAASSAHWFAQVGEQLSGLREQAAQGHAAAQYYLAVCYYHGAGVAKDHNLYAEWLQRAASQEYLPAQNALGASYFNGEGYSKNQSQAAVWWQRAASQGYARAQYNLAFFCYQQGNGAKQDAVQAVHWLQKAAEQGHTDAQHSLGDCYANGKGVQENKVKARYWHQCAAEHGHAEAQYALAAHYLETRGGTAAPATAIKWLRLAMEQGHLAAQTKLEALVAQGDRQAMLWSQRTADQGNALAQRWLGNLYAVGSPHVPPDMKQALVWYERAAKTDPEAAYSLAKCYEQDRGVVSDVKQAAHWYESAARRQHPRAQYQLAQCYQHGKGVLHQAAKAAHWYQQAAQLGHRESQYQIACCYQQGLGKEQDLIQAKDWFQRAAEQNHAEAQYQLALCYQKGWGTVPEPAQALKWYHQAVLKGHVAAAEILVKALPSADASVKAQIVKMLGDSEVVTTAMLEALVLTVTDADPAICTAGKAALEQLFSVDSRTLITVLLTVLQQKKTEEQAIFQTLLHHYLQKAFFNAAVQGQLEYIKWLRQQGASLTEKDGENNTALHTAVMAGHLPIVQWLLAQNISLVEKNAAGESPLMLAVARGYLALAKELVERGAPLNEKDIFGNTFLTVASGMGHYEIVAWLLSSGISPNEKLKSGLTALMTAALGGHLATVELLITHKALIREEDNNGNTAFLYAAARGHWDLMQFLLERGASVLKKDKMGNTPLLAAAAGGHLDIVQWLVTQGASLTDRNTVGANALILAANGGNIELMKWLSSGGKMSLLGKDSLGHTLIMYAAFSGKVEAIQWLWEQGVSLTEQNMSGETALLIATFCGHLEVVKWLLNHGFSVTEKNHFGFTALLMAAAYGRLELAQWLLAHGASLTEKNNFGQTAFLIAAGNGRIEVVEWLLNQQKEQQQVVSLPVALLWTDNSPVIESKHTLQGQPVKDDDREGALHAILGTWNAVEKRYVCPEVMQHRAMIRQTIADNKEDVHLHELTMAGIKARVIAGSSIGKESQQLLAHHQRYLDGQYALSPAPWLTFEAVLRKCPSVMNYLASHYPQETTASMRAQFYTVLDQEASKLTKLIQSFPKLSAAFHDYHETDQTTFTKNLSLGAIKEYADFIGAPGQPLSAHELAIIAHIFGMTLIYYPNVGADPLRFNEGQATTITVQLNDQRHFERVAPVVNQLESKQELQPLLKDAKTMSSNVAQSTALDSTVLTSHLKERDSEGNTALLLASFLGKLEMVQWLMAKGASLMERNKIGATPLLMAAVVGQLDVVEWLLAQGASVTEKSKDGVSALHLAAGSGQLKVVQLLAEEKASLFETDGAGNTPLFWAAREGKLEVVQWLIGQRASLVERNNRGRSAVLVAAGSGHIEVLRYLVVDQKASLAERDRYGMSALLLATIGGHLKVMQWLVDRGVSVAEKDKDGGTALLLAALNGHVEAIQWLLAKDASLQEENYQGHTALLMAVRGGKLETTQWLLKQRGVSLTQRDNAGNTALMLAASRGHREIVEFLLTQAGVSLKEENSAGQSALLVAAANGQQEIVEWLLSSRGSSLAERDKAGCTALLIAVKNGQMNIVNFLVEQGVSLTETDHTGGTALLLAIMGGSIRTVAFLQLLIVSQALRKKEKLDNLFALTDKDKFGKGAFLYAASGGHVNMMEWVLKQGCTLDDVDGHGMTALLWAAVKGKVAAMHWLTTWGASLAEKNKQGETALVLAAKQGQFRAVRWLLAQDNLNVTHKNSLEQTALEVAIERMQKKPQYASHYRCIAEELIYAYEKRGLALPAVAVSWRGEDKKRDKEQKGIGTPNAMDSMEQARRAFIGKHYLKALEIYSRLSTPESVFYIDALIGCGKVLARLERSSEALEKFEQVLKMGSLCFSEKLRINALNNVGNLWQKRDHKENSEEDRKKTRQKAIECFLQVLKLKPDDKYATERLAAFPPLEVATIKEKLTIPSAPTSQTPIKTSGGTSDGIKREIKEKKEGKLKQKSGISLPPSVKPQPPLITDPIKTLCQTADDCLREGNVDEAIEIYEALIKRPESPSIARAVQESVLHNLACAYHVRSHQQHTEDGWLQAKETFEKAIRIKPIASTYCEYALFLYLKGVDQLQKEQFDQAIMYSIEALTTEQEGGLYYSWVERETLPACLRSLVDAPSSAFNIGPKLLAQYLLVSCYCHLNQLVEAQTVLKGLEKIARTQTTTLTDRLLAAAQTEYAACEKLLKTVVVVDEAKTLDPASIHFREKPSLSVPKTVPTTPVPQAISIGENVLPALIVVNQGSTATVSNTNPVITPESKGEGNTKQEEASTQRTEAPQNPLIKSQGKEHLPPLTSEIEGINSQVNTGLSASSDDAHKPTIIDAVPSISIPRKSHAATKTRMNAFPIDPKAGRFNETIEFQVPYSSAVHHYFSDLAGKTGKGSQGRPVVAMKHARRSTSTSYTISLSTGWLRQLHQHYSEDFHNICHKLNVHESEILVKIGVTDLVNREQKESGTPLVQLPQTSAVPVVLGVGSASPSTSMPTTPPNNLSSSLTSSSSVSLFASTTRQLPVSSPSSVSPIPNANDSKSTHRPQSAGISFLQRNPLEDGEDTGSILTSSLKPPGGAPGEVS